MAEEDARPESRRHRRFFIRVPLYISIEGTVVRRTVHLESRDVSAGGMSFETGRDVPLAAESQVVLASMGEERSTVSIRGRVVWTRPIPETGRFCVGVMFTDFDGLSREELASRIESFVAG